MAEPFKNLINTALVRSAGFDAVRSLPTRLPLQAGVLVARAA